MVATPVTPYIQFPEPRRAATAPYTRIPDAVLLDARVTPVQLRVYAIIARRADRETASAFPSYATIARDAAHRSVPGDVDHALRSFRRPPAPTRPWPTAD